MSVFYGNYNTKDGSTSERAADNAVNLVNLGITTNGVYWINLPTVGPTQIYCILDSAYDGGGWMMMMKATRGTTFYYGSTYWTSVNTLNPTQTNLNDGDAKFDVMNYYSSKDMMARFPDIGQGGSIGGVGVWTWLQNNFYGGTRVTPIWMFGNTSRYFIGDAKLFSGWAGNVFSSQVDVRFYGYNYYNNQNIAKVRWGFGWNENGGGLYPNGNMDSDDVSGGIGMVGTQQGTVNYSAGDYIGCCQDNTGLNRSMRVEIYVR